MKWIFSGLIILSVIFGALNDQMPAVSNAAISEGTKAIELSITLAGTLCLWSGLMQVAQKSGLTEKIAMLLSPITQLLFKGIARKSKAMALISMNITANMLGLGNAATPLGIAAMTELSTESENGVASPNMIMLVVLNTASIQIIPTTVAALRLKFGAASPFDILPAVWISSIAALVVGISAAMILRRFASHKIGGEQSK